MSEERVNSTEQISYHSASCIILWVDRLYLPNSHRGEFQHWTGPAIKMKVRSHFINYEILNKISQAQDLNKMPQAVHLTNMTTFFRAWEVHRLGLGKLSRMSIIYKDHVSVSSSIFPSTISLHCTSGQPIFLLHL
jgi:hypothetical protein